MTIENLKDADGVEIILPLDEDGDATIVFSRRDEFERAVADHHRQLARLAFLMCSDVHQAEDAVAEAYARTWPKFRRGSIDDLRPYLRRAVVNQIYGGFRRRYVERREAERRGVDWRDGVSHENATEDAQLVASALQSLPSNQRVVVVLRYFEDLSEDEIATALGVPAGTVKSRCARGLDQLRRVLTPAMDMQ